MVKSKCNIQTEEVTDNHPQLHIEAKMVRFTNGGQTGIVIDESIFIKPGQSYVEGDLNKNSCIISHNYKVSFYTVSSPPSILPNQVNAGNMLFIRTFNESV